MKKILIIPMIAAVLAFAGSASAQMASGPSLMVQLQSAGVAPTIAAGAQNVVLANVRLDATNSTDGIRLTSLPIILTTGNGGVASNLQSCQVANAVAPGVALNSGTNAVANLSSGSNSIGLDTPLVIARGTSVNLLVSCDISPSLTAGGTYQFSINTSNVSATAVSTGLPAVVGAGTAVVVTNPPVVPGIPNTGFGETSTTNLLLIASSLVVAGLGFAYTRKVA